MRLAHPLEPEALDELGNSAEASSHVGGERVKFSPDAIVQQFYDPRHRFQDIAFLQYRQAYGRILHAGGRGRGASRPTPPTQIRR